MHTGYHDNQNLKCNFSLEHLKKIISAVLLHFGLVTTDANIKCGDRININNASQTEQKKKKKSQKFYES